MSAFRFYLFVVILGMAGTLNAAEPIAPADPIDTSCDYDPATSLPVCTPDESLVTPPQLPEGDAAVAEQPPSSLEAGGSGPNSRTSVPPPAPIPPKPSPPAEEPSGGIAPPQPKPQP
ncbi:MAG TPA: hypothetical protein VEA39_05940 [Methylophilaceae bacterium]|nr:hypothetical protein [Methylophilaceae bacterium]